MSGEAGGGLYYPDSAGEEPVWDTVMEQRAEEQAEEQAEGQAEGGAIALRKQRATPQ